MSCFFRSILLLSLSIIATAYAAPPPVALLHTSHPSASYSYVDAVSGLRLNVPTGWRVRAETLNGVRQLRVVPPKADQRERAAIDVVIRVRNWLPGESVSRLAARYRRQQDDREAAQTLHFTPKTGRLVLDYREGRYVSGRLWIVRRNLHIFQRQDRRRVLEARCAANASEYKTYRKNLQLLCYSAQVQAGKS